ncbi:helix-turn-helix domain-containing protein [Leucobacter weissii]|uniref:Helix-turn-helix domain-containing protein n=1 Tax=Leucobacter weissii TaxID=1983706 RepID=A0A939ML50_9MICO|nr:helix-turn-helix domain-containing protein [Leucobacter weissii]MBO1902768.1 helix-turn-helix domain-containing protein [Leucobacter weissii]
MNSDTGRFADRLDHAQFEAVVDVAAAEFRRRFRESGLTTRYRELVSAEEIMDTSHDTMHDLIGLIVRGSAESGDLPAARELGRRRARQGVPLEVLLEAIRLNSRVLWGRLIALAAQEQAAELVSYVEDVLVLVERYALEVQHSYLREEARLRKDFRLVSERQLSRLFTGDGELHSDEIAARLGVDPAARLEVVIARGTAAAAMLTRLDASLSSGAAFGSEIGGTNYAFRPHSPSEDPWTRNFADLECVVLDDLPGLKHLPSTITRIVDLFDRGSLPEGRCLRFQDIWPTIAAHALHGIMPGAHRRALAAILRIPEPQRSVLLSTVRLYLRSGSIRDTASAMFCHRNTVVNRLGSFKKTTGLDLGIPADAALAHFVLAESRP